MGILDLLNKDKRAERKLAKAIKRATHPYMQSEERMRAAEMLQEIGTDEAIYGILKRFTINAHNQVVDEGELQQVYGMVVDLGAKAVPSILRFIRREERILHPLKALTEIEPEERVVGHIAEALAHIGPEYIKNSEPKLHLVQHLATIETDRMPEILGPFIEDQDEGVRFQVVAALRPYRGPVTGEALLGRLMGEEEESLRVRRVICEALSEHQFAVGEERKEPVLEILTEVGGWKVDEQGRIQRK
jgi:HEAT repeat protein